MTDIEIINGYAEKFYAKPVLKTWTPKEWELGYYNTPKRLEKERAKRDAAYAKDYEREMRDYTEFTNAVGRIARMPQGLVHLFAQTAKWIVEENAARRRKIEAEMKAFTDVYDRTIEYTYEPNGDEPYTTTFNPAKDAETHYLLSAYDFKNGCWNPSFRNEYRKAQINCVADTDEGRVAYMKALLKYSEDGKELRAMRSDASLFVEFIGECARVMDGIWKTLGGDPDECSYDVGWGVGSHFNGIVSRDGKRASFKSFLAGGWNIQRLHVRFRVTLLKAA